MSEINQQHSSFFPLLLRGTDFYERDEFIGWRNYVQICICNSMKYSIPMPVQKDEFFR